MTSAKSCEHEGLSTASFYVWKRRLRGGDVTALEPGVAQPIPQQALFVPVAVTPLAGDVRVDVSGGVVADSRRASAAVLPAGSPGCNLAGKTGDALPATPVARVCRARDRPTC